MKIVLIGGHFTPALAVIKKLPEGTQVVFIGRASSFEGSKEKSLESSEMQRRGIKFYALTTARLQREISFKFFSSFFKLPKGFIQAMQILRSEKPDVVIGFGGYLSLPVGYAAFFLKIPLIIHEQTFNAGLANKMLAKIASRICISWETSLSQFPKEKTVLTGNPLLIDSSGKKDSLFFKNSQSKLPILLVAGGSSGSHALNVLLENALPVLLNEWRVMHLTGDAKEYEDFARLEKYRNSLSEPLANNYEVRKFVSPEEIEILMDQAKIFLGRSGINTVSLALFLGKPSLFIPLPTGQKGEQLENAKAAERAGIARVLLQSDASSEMVITALDEMTKDYQKYKEKGDKSRLMINGNAGENIVKEIEYVVKKKTS